MTTAAHPAAGSLAFPSVRAGPIGPIVARKFGFRPVERARLFLSYQRFALAMFAAAFTPLTLVALVLADRWWAWVAAGLFALKLSVWAFEIARRYPEKLRATGVAQRRIDGGRFEHRMVRRFTGDPCFKVVAREILDRAGIPTDEREAIIRTYAAELHDENHGTLIVDHVNGVVLRSEGGRLVPIETPLPASHPQTVQTGAQT